MSAECKYGAGDVENIEVVDFNHDQQSRAIACPQPQLRETSLNNPNRKAGQDLIRLEMDVHFVNDDGIMTTKTLVADYDESEGSFDKPLIGAFRKKKQCVQFEKKWHSRRCSCSSRCVRKSLALSLANVTGEMVGTFLLTVISCCTVASAVITGAQTGLWQVAVIIGVGVGISIYCTSHFSDAHLNPAITVAFSIVRWKTFSWKKIFPYVIAQTLGGVLAGGVTYGIYRRAIEHFEIEHDIIRGTNTSVLTAMLFGEYFPAPVVYDHSVEENLAIISPVEAMLVEAWATCIFAFVIFSVTHKGNTAVGNGSSKVAVPILIGITLAVLVSMYGSLTQVGANPARDFGPRLFAVFAGWWEIAIPGPKNGFWVYIVGPLIGAVIGGALYDVVVVNIVKLAKSAKHKSIDLDSFKTVSATNKLAIL